jgi:hypothetical protein
VTSAETPLAAKECVNRWWKTQYIFKVVLGPLRWQYEERLLIRDAAYAWFEGGGNVCSAKEKFPSLL